MANKIWPVTPVFEHGKSIIFGVEVDSASSGFTWVIAREEANGSWKVAANGRKARTPDTDGGLEFTIVCKPVRELAEGAYQLLLYGRGVRVQAEGNLPKKARPLAQDSFAVVAKGDFPSGGLRGDGGAIQVQLVKDTTRAVAPGQFPSYLGFREGVGASGWETLLYGGASYQALLNKAKEYLKDFTVTTFDDIAPGYLEDRLKDPLHVLDVAVQRRLGGTQDLPRYELIWNYWQEEGMLVQTLNVILARFQNRRLPGRDPLARFDVTPLLALRNLLWDFAEEEQHRLTVRRRAAEYEYEYGLSLIGRAVPSSALNVERRSGFVEAFHRVIHLAHAFYKEFDDLTVNADAFPLYRALRDCHLVLSQGSQNQYGELAHQARAEFIVMQTILAEPQMREFLGGRPMTPYREPWMDRVDGMKTIQGWTDTSVMHFDDLATFSEQLVLSIRLGNWAGETVGKPQAEAWATAFRDPIQKYNAALTSATGVDLSTAMDATMPSTLLAQRLGDQRLRA